MRTRIFHYLLLCLFGFACSGKLLLANEKQWPKEIKSSKGTIIIYQPDIESLTNDKMEARSAVSVTTAESDIPVFGAMWYDCRISTDRDERTVTLLDLKVISARFPDMEDQQVEKVQKMIETEVPKWQIVMSLDDLLTALEFNEQIVSSASNLNNEAPEIIFTTTLSALVLIDGEPKYKDFDGSGFQYVVNSPFFIARDKKSKVHFLKGGNYWYESNASMEKWEVTEKPPKKLVEEAKALEVQVADSATAEDFSASPPEIIIRTKPAELLQSNGNPEYAPVEGTSLLYMSNSDDDILMNIDSQEYFILIAGRWYRSKSLTGNQWAYVAPDKLPEEFQKIPQNSPVGNVRHSVKGTPESKEAVLETAIPQTAEVDRNSATVKVEYDGKPKFEAIEGTSMYYAVNTDKSVLRINGRYYCCDNAVWFESASSEGPWKVCVSVPETVKDIPPQSPVYNVKYVYVYDYTPEVVYVGYTSGYVYSYAYNGVVYYGTGYYHQPWYGYYYFPRPVTYGYSVRYNPYSGWGFSFGVAYGGYHGWMHYGYHYHHAYAGYWGPAGYRHGYGHGYHHGYNQGYYKGYKRGYYESQRNNYNRPAPVNTASGRRTSATNNVYANRNNGVVRSGSSNYNPHTGERVSVNQPSNRASAPTNRSNDMYSNKSGDVYKRDNNGNWQQQQNRTTTSDRNTGTQTRQTQTDRTQSTQTRDNQTQTNRQPAAGNPNDNLNRQYESRNRSTQRSQDYQQNRQSYQYSKPSGAQGGNRSSAQPSQPSRSSARPAGGGSGARRR